MEVELCAGSSPVALGEWHLHQQEPAVGLHGCCVHVDFSASSIENICSEGRSVLEPCCLAILDREPAWPRANPGRDPR